MSGEQGELGVKPGGAAALEQRPHGHAKQQPRVEGEPQSHQAEPRAVGSGSRLIHRLAILTLFVGASAALVAWVVALVWGVLWVWGQLPLV